MKKIKLIIFPGFFKPHTGGLESHVDNFVKRLSEKEEYDITIFVPEIPISKEKEIIYNNVKVIRYPAFEAVFNFPVPKVWSMKFWSLYLNLYKQNFNVAMTRTLFFTNSTLGLFFSKFRFKPIKLIHVEHGSSFTKLESKFKSFVNKLYILTLGKLLVKMSDEVIAVSTASKKYLLKDILNQKQLKKSITVIRRGFDYQQFDKIQPLSLLKSNNIIMNQYKDKKIICFVGRLIKGKGVQEILSALYIIPDKYNDKYKFLIIGEGDEEENLKNYVEKHHMENNVNFLGKLPYEEVISILKMSDIFINLSYSEGLPTTVIEAYFSNCSIMATNVGGTYEILSYIWDKSRYNLVEVSNNKDIQRLDIVSNSMKLTKMIDSYVKYKLNPLEVQEIKNKFDWNKHIKKYDKIIKKLLK